MRIIAELGTNWDDLHGILTFIPEIAKAGATGFKLQFFGADDLYSKERAPKIYQTLKEYELTPEWIPEISETCHNNDIEFWMSFFDGKRLELGAEYVDGIKIASGDLTNHLLINQASWYAAKYKIPLVLSDGAGTEEEVYHAIDHAYTCGPKVTLLHCISEYPAQPRDYQLRFIERFRDDVDELGISDHTAHSISIVSSMGVAIGCTSFEKHVKPSNLKRKTPDSGPHSLLPIAFTLYAHELRDADAALGNGITRELTIAENKERLWARRGDDGLRPTSGVHE